jgi:hypothetical protein
LEAEAESEAESEVSEVGYAWFGAWFEYGILVSSSPVIAIEKVYTQL